MTLGEGGFPGDDDESSVLFERHVCRPREEIVGQGGPDNRDGLHRRRDDDHARRPERAGDDRRTESDSS